MALSSEWTDGLKSEKEKEELRTMINSSIPLRRLGDIIKAQLKELDRKDANDDYQSPAWPYLQADRQGQVRVYRRILSLLPDQEK